MKKELIGIFVALLFCTLTSVAQGNKAKLKGKVEARKVAFITNKLQFSPKEAQQFWPLYNDFQKKRKAINHTYNRQGNLNQLSDEAVADYVDSQLEKEEKLLSLKKEYVNQLKLVLPIRKVAMLPRVEKRFKEWMLEQIKKRRANN